MMIRKNMLAFSDIMLIRLDMKTECSTPECEFSNAYDSFYSRFIGKMLWMIVSVTLINSFNHGFSKICIKGKKDNSSG